MPTRLEWEPLCAAVCCADPDHWNIPASDFAWVNTYFVHDRAQIAQAANKPIIIEETGMIVSPVLRLNLSIKFAGNDLA
jgi:hypothetical protein